MASHTPYTSTDKYMSMKVSGYIQELPDCSRLVIQAPHNMLKAEVKLLHPGEKINYSITADKVQTEECLPWKSNRRPNHEECGLLNMWRRSQNDNLCNGRHNSISKARRCTGATRPNGPSWIPTPYMTQRQENDNKKRGLHKTKTPFASISVSTPQRPVGGTRPTTRAYLMEKYPSLRAQISRPCQPMRARPVSPVRINRIVGPDHTTFELAGSPKSNSKWMLHPTHSISSSSGDETPDLVEAEVSQSGASSSDNEVRKEFQPPFGDLPGEHRAEIIERMRGDMELARFYYTGYVVSGYTKEEIMEHIEMTFNCYEQKEKEYWFAVGVRKHHQQRKTTPGETQFHLKMLNEWKLSVLEVMKTLNPQRYFLWMPIEIQQSIRKRVNFDYDLIPHYLNGICKGKSIRQIKRHLEVTREMQSTLEWEVQQCKILYESAVMEKLGKKEDKDLTGTELWNKYLRKTSMRSRKPETTRRVVMDQREKIVAIGVSELNKSIKDYQDLRQEFHQDLSQVVDLTKKNNDMLATFLAAPRSPIIMPAAMPTVPKTEGPSVLSDQTQPQTPPTGMSQAKSDTEILVRDLLDTGIIDKSQFNPENWAQAPPALNSDVEGAINEAMMEEPVVTVKTEPSSPVTELAEQTEDVSIN